MISLGSLERRLSALESPYNSDIDFEGLEIQAFEALTDNELGLLEEFHSLRQSRFSTPEIESMMGDESYRAAIAGIEKADREYKRSIASPARPKRRGKSLELPKEHRYDEFGLGIREDAEA